MNDKKAWYCRQCHIEIIKKQVKFHNSGQHILNFIPLNEIPYSETIEFARQAEKIGRV